MHAALERAAGRFGSRSALLAGDGCWSFRDLNEQANAFAHHLAGLGVQPGSRVALMASNRPEFIVAVNAISKLGAATVLLSPAWKSREVGHALELTRPGHAVADGDSTALFAGTLAVVDLDGPGLFDHPASHPPDRGRVAGGDEAVLVFSSGTTGLPKAVRHTHSSIANGAACWVEALGLTHDDRFQITTPPSHILGLLNLLAAAHAGATVRLHKRFDLDEVLRRIEVEQMTLEMAVAPIALAIANHPKLENFDLSSLRFILWGATPVAEAVARRVTERTGVRWLVGYGASELPVIAVNPVHRPDAWKLGSVGLAAAGVELRVCDLDTGATLGPDEVGEIQAKSPSVMAGYLPEDANEDGFADGWYRTGDVGFISVDGWVHLTDRSKEMIKVKGFQVAPAEIEAVLHSHPSVLDCAVFGVPDEQAGERPVAAVKLDPSATVDPGQLIELVRVSLATYKHLSEVTVVDEIPRLPSGKVLRRNLRDVWLSGR